MQDVVSRTQMDAMIQEQLSGYQARLDTLEQMLAAKLSSLTDSIDDSIENRLQPLRQDVERFRSDVNQQDTGRLIEQLSGYQARLDTLEQMSAQKSNSNSNKLGLFALLTGASAIVISVYQLLQ